MPSPNYEKAALKATETLIKYQISSAPISPFPILKSLPGVLVISFAEMAESMGTDRKNIIDLFGSVNQDAVTSLKRIGDKVLYVVAYNQRLPFYLLQRSLARELGHILLYHDGSRPESVRNEEALHFARHLICPRPLIRAVQESGIPFTTEMLGNITGCYERCLAGIRKTPGSHVPAELNRKVRELFADYIQNFLSFQTILSNTDDSNPADFGTYMDNYEE